MKRLLLLAASSLLMSISFAQYCPGLGPDQFLPCGVNSTTLTADLSLCTQGGPSPNQTTNYGVTTIPYVAQTNTGTNITLSDDSQQGPFNIGFPFCFFGQTYTQFWVGSNGWISFSAGQPTTFTSTPIPSAAGTVPKNCIMGPWQDWNPGIGGQVKYQLQGTAPCRKLVVSWINVPMYSCTNVQGTFHIVIYESTNYIENHIAVKPNCLQWANGTAVQGIQNLAGSVAITTPGRNSTQWTALNDARRWTPSGPAVTPNLVWYQVGNPTPIAQNVNTITVTPPAGGASYTCHLEYPSCNAGWATCNATPGILGPDTVLVVPGPPNLSSPAVQITNPTCVGSCDGSLLITPFSGTQPYTIAWANPLTGFNPIGICAGTYNFTIFDVNGCSVNGFAVLVDPPLVTVSPIAGSDTICLGSTSEIFSVANQPGYTYIWQSVGNVVSGQGTSTAVIDWSALPPGFLPNAVQVVAVNSSGCASAPSFFNPLILSVDPVIDSIGPFCTVDNCVNLSATPSGGTFSISGVNITQFCPQLASQSNQVIYTYTQSGCTFYDTTNVTVNTTPDIIQVSPDNVLLEVCDSAQITFTATTSPPLGSTTWTILNTQITGNPITVTWEEAVGTYIITAVHTLNNCVSSPYSTSVVIEECPRLLVYIPNAFTPDGDEHNHEWKPTFSAGLDPFKYNLIVVNRWGETIFESFNPNVGWDGYHAKLPCQEGVYTYMLTYGPKDTGKVETVIGHITLIR